MRNKGGINKSDWRWVIGERRASTRFSTLEKASLLSAVVKLLGKCAIPQVCWPSCPARQQRCESEREREVAKERGREMETAITNLRVYNCHFCTHLLLLLRVLVLRLQPSSSSCTRHTVIYGRTGSAAPGRQLFSIMTILVLPCFYAHCRCERTLLLFYQCYLIIRPASCSHNLQYDYQFICFLLFIYIGIKAIQQLLGQKKESFKRTCIKRPFTSIRQDGKFIALNSVIAFSLIIHTLPGLELNPLVPISGCATFSGPTSDPL